MSLLSMHRLRFGLLLVAACVRPAAVLGQTPAPPATAANFASEIAQFEAADRTNPPPQGGILFVGSSSFRLWPDIQKDFPGVLNRGFGGSTFADVLYYAPRIIPPARPRLIVLYVGDNDLAAGRTPEQVAGDYSTFVAWVRRTLPGTRVAYVSIKPSPSRWALVDSMRRANSLIAAQIARDSSGAYVDVFTPMIGANGRPTPSLFVGDSLHMTPAGYAIWRAQLAPVVR